MASEKVEVILDTQKCQGYGLCLGSDDVFELDSAANIAHLKLRFVDISRKDEIEQVVRDCPAGAISLRVVQE
ncbi:ferredoxin [Pseudomonas lalucatii]|uniref:Ferredoxin n=1 Tax=Pseudomonas lalucatii TaxID=1424203 RepID=A0ABS5Q4J5_9PSED|nr:ferredoxin [Pseudomonas lalucatii]MBS7663622.1 ferredoxin [Pseudomonas lalucatii]MBS7725121.1 ferredoxin [Pseudomonas lalucatii]QVM86910.1 ferredoxin [Pseudomonas lalucatii]